MPNAQQCPKCKRFILGDYCFTWKEDINNMKKEIPDFFKDMFGQDNFDGFNYFGKNNE